MKNVLSPISDRNMSEKAARKPERPSTDCAAHSCGSPQQTLSTGTFLPVREQQPPGQLVMQRQRRGSSARLQQRRVAAGVYAGAGGCEQRQRAAHPQQRLALATARPQQ